MIKEAGIKLGVGDLYKLLACMVSRKSYEDLIDETKQDYNERLRFVNTEEERQKLQRHVRHSAREITHVLHRINRYKELLTKLKVIEKLFCCSRPRTFWQLFPTSSAKK